MSMRTLRLAKIRAQQAGPNVENLDTTGPARR
jgi:hypothetical protein